MGWALKRPWGLRKTAALSAERIPEVRAMLEA